MLDALATYWHRLKSGEPGQRFLDVFRLRTERRNEGHMRSRALFTGGGLLLILIGAGIGWLPGPGGVLAVLGVALVAAESRSVARTLDWVELRLRTPVRRGRDVWQTRGLAGRILLSALGLAIVGGAAVGLGVVVF